MSSTFLSIEIVVLQFEVSRKQKNIGVKVTVLLDMFLLTKISFLGFWVKPIHFLLLIASEKPKATNKLFFFFLLVKEKCLLFSSRTVQMDGNTGSCLLAVGEFVSIKVAKTRKTFHDLFQSKLNRELLDRYQSILSTKRITK